MSNFDLWVKGCELNNTKIYELEKSLNVSLYKTWRVYCDGRNYCNANVLFHVWNHDKHLVTTNYIEGYKMYERFKEGSE